MLQKGMNERLLFHKVIEVPLGITPCYLDPEFLVWAMGSDIKNKGEPVYIWMQATIVQPRWLIIPLGFRGHNCYADKNGWVKS
jgi:hypothetical protein